MTDTAASLHQWARGQHPTEAAVTLLTTAFSGRFAHPSYPWIRPTDRGGWWVDADQINADTIGAYSGGEQRLLRIAASLAGGDPVRLDDTLPGLDDDLARLVIGAITHATGL